MLHVVAVTQSPKFSAHVCCGQTAGWITMPLGMEDGGRPQPSHIVLDGDPASPPNESGTAAPNIWPICIVAKLCMDQDAASYEGRPRPRPHCVR